MRAMRRVIAPFIAPFLALVLSAAALAQSPQRLPAITLRAGMHQVQAMVAESPAQREIGLMHRSEMAQHEGMLFVFEAQATQCFWMRNTPLPLSIAFLADDGRIVNVREMKAFDDKSQHCSEEPVRYALEMNQGWFAKRGLKPGSKLAGPPFSSR
jgi:uncharacterized protein